jgi:hypothetical protein
MAYTPREIKDRVAVGDDIFQVEDLGNNRIRLIPAPTHVSEPGTLVNKALLQPIEDALGAITQKLSGMEVVFAQVDEVVPGGDIGTVTRVASSPTDYNTIKFDTLLPAGSDTAWFGVTFPSLGDVVVGTPEYHLSTSPTLYGSDVLGFYSFQDKISFQIRDISIYHGIETFAQSRVRFLATRETGTGALNDIYLHFRFTGLKLA